MNLWKSVGMQLKWKFAEVFWGVFEVKIFVQISEAFDKTFEMDFRRSKWNVINFDLLSEL